MPFTEISVVNSTFPPKTKSLFSLNRSLPEDNFLLFPVAEYETLDIVPFWISTPLGNRSKVFLVC